MSTQNSNQNSKSKTIGSRIKDIFVTLVGLFLLSIIGLQYYSAYQFNKQNPDLYLPRAIKGEKPSKEKITKLLNDLTDNLPQQGRTYYKNQGVYESFVLISKTYLNPTQQTINQLENNITQQQIWTEIKPKDAQTKAYCHDQIMLTTHYNRTDIHRYLHVAIRWEAVGDCRKLYYNPDKDFTKRLLQSP